MSRVDTLEKRLAQEEWQDESSDDESYPSEAIITPFSIPCSLMIGKTDQLVAGCHYLYLSKHVQGLSKTFWYLGKEDGMHWIQVNPEEAQMMFGSTLEELFDHNYCFRVSVPLGIFTARQFLTLETPSELEKNTSYLFLPNEHPERVKLMKFKTQSAGTKSYNLLWCSYKDKLNVSFSPSTLEKIMKSSEVFKVKW